MNNIVYCSECKSNGRSNICYIIGYDSKCGHDVGWAYEKIKMEAKLLHAIVARIKIINVI